MEIRQAAIPNRDEREMMEIESSPSNLVTSTTSSFSTNPFALPQSQRSRITLKPIRSALLLSSSLQLSNSAYSLPTSTLPPRKPALYDEPLLPLAHPTTTMTTTGEGDEVNEVFVSNRGRNLRVRKGVRPSYLEIPPSVHPLIEEQKEKGKGKGKEREKEKGGDEVRGKKRKRSTAIIQGGGGDGNSSLSELTSSEEELKLTRPPKKKKKKIKKIKLIKTIENDRDSSPLSSLDSSSSHSLSSLSSSNSSSSESESESDSTLNSPLPLHLEFSSKPASHPLNRIKIKPRPLLPPPRIQVFRGLNPWSWEEGLRGLMLNQEVVEPTFFIEDEEEGEREVLGDGDGLGDGDVGGGKKKPSWEWAIDPREVSPIVPRENQATSIAHPPPPTPSKFNTKTSTSSLSLSLFLEPAQPQQPRSQIPLVLPAPAPNPNPNLVVVNVKPKTYRQLAKLDWEDFHQRNRCRFTTSGSIEGVNPEGLGWEDWFGVEDEGCLSLKRDGGIVVSSSSKRKGKGGGLVVFDQGEGGLRSLGGEGREQEFENLKWEQSFESGMEWGNCWRWKSLEEGKGNCLEDKCGWAVRNPARVYQEEIRVKVSQEEREMVMTRERERLRRKREKKKLKRERERREREGSGGESELTPFEGEELSADSSDLNDDGEEQGDLQGDSAEMIAKRSSLILQEAAETHAQSGKAGVMVKCPLVGCPQQFYRSKASSSVSTHARHYHTTHLNLKYATGKSAYIQRDSKGDFTCPATGCGFITKSRGTMAVHGKPGKCEGPAVSIPKPTRRKKGKRYKLPPPQAVVASTTTPAAAVDVPHYFGAANKSSRFLSSEFISSSDDEVELEQGGSPIDAEE